MVQTRKKGGKSKKAKGKLSDVQRKLEESRREIQRLKEDIRKFNLHYKNISNINNNLRRSKRTRKSPNRFSPRF